MSRLAVTLIALLMLVLGSSCVPSVHGIATESNVLFRPELVGSWVSDDGQSAWNFADQDQHGYLLSIETPDGTDGTFYAALVELEGELFLDLFPADSDPNWPINSFYGLHFLPVHTFMHVQLAQGSLGLRMMDPSWLDAWLAQNPDGVKHEHESFTVLTASTPELQALLPRLLNEEPIPDSGFMGGDSAPFTDPLMMTPGVMSTAPADAEMSDEELEDVAPQDSAPATP